METEKKRKTQRLKLSSTKRWWIAYRQKYRCVGEDCKGKKTLLPPTLEIDHIVPLHLNGSNEQSNLQALCPNCHRIKTQLEMSKRTDQSAAERIRAQTKELSQKQQEDEEGSLLLCLQPDHSPLPIAKPDVILVAKSKYF